MAMAAPSGRAKRRKARAHLAIDSIIAEGEQPDVVLELNGDPTPRRRSRASRAVCVATQVCYFLIHAL